MTTKPAIAHCAQQIAPNEEGTVPSELMLLAGGRIEGRDGRWWLNDAPHDIVMDFEMQGVDLQIDYEHASELAEPNGQPIPAAGWITGLEVRDGALWGTVNWTGRASQMITDREYRYFSPTFYFDDDRSIVGLISVALTNNPNFRQAALNKSEGTGTPHTTQEPTMDKAARIALCKSLGLADEASDAAIQAAVNALQGERDKALNSANTPSLEKFVPRADHDKVKADLETANNALAEIADKEVADVVNGAVAAGKIEPSNKDFYLAACRTDEGLASFKRLIGDIATNAVAQTSDLDTQDPTQITGKLTPDEKAMCRMMGQSEEDFLKTRDAMKAA